MNIYETRQDVIDELIQHLQVEYKPYGTWKIKSYLGGRFYNKEHYVEVSYFSHNESDSIGYFDGEKYNPYSFEDWLADVAYYELEDIEEYHDDELQEMYREYCNGLWFDSGNENNYEPTEERFKRLAENLFDDLYRNLPENVFDTVNGKLVVLTEEEKEFIYIDTNLIGALQEERFSDYIKAFNEWSNNE